MTLKRKKGYIDACSIIQPLNIKNLEYKLRLNPESYLFYELEEVIKQLQEDLLIQEPPNNPDTPPIPPTNIIDGCVMNLQTIRKPRLIGSLIKLDRDDALSNAPDSDGVYFQVPPTIKHNKEQ